LSDDRDRAEFAQLVLPHLDAAYNLARWLIRHDQDAEDIVQEAFLRAWRSFAGFHGTDGRPWLLAIVRNTCYTALDRIRSSSARPLDQTHIQDRHTRTSPDDPIIRREEETSIARALEELAPEFREVLVLREFEELSYKQIAGAMHDCSQLLQQRETLRNRLRDPSLYRRAPAPLRERVRAIAPSHEPGGRFWHSPPWQLAAVAACVAFLLFGGWGLWRSLSGARSQDLLAEAILDSHVRSLLGSHLIDIAGPDRHVVKPWFARQLDFSPAIVNLDPQGFTLEGGRADYVDHRKVASIVYKRRQHIINLFVWPVPTETAGGEMALQRQGYNMVHWIKSGFSYWAVSDLNKPELESFARLIREQSE
jgi:RNA polymerase sigma factor (sigma-70 family)